MTVLPSPPRPRWSAAQVAAALGLPTPTTEQQAVIEAPLRSMLVVAGAGSGKTETMSARVVWLVANGLVAPERILGLTFTRKAAGELAERIGARLRRLAETDLGVDATVAEPDSAPTVATYHSYAGGLVGEHGLRLGIEPDARLLTEAAAWQYAQDVVLRHDGPMDAVPNAESTVIAAVRDLAGQMAEHLVTLEELGRYLHDVEATIEGLPMGEGRSRGIPAEVKGLLAHVRAQSQVLPLLQRYARTKAASESLDFADQMALAATLAEIDTGVARAERERYSVVLLDEFQDTSEAQMRLLHAVFADPAAGVTRPVMAVGDPHQSIYGWRGASATTLAAFPVRFTVPSAAWVSASTAEHGAARDEATGPAADPTPAVDGPPLVPQVLPLSTSWRNDEAVLAAANVIASPLTAASPVPVRTLRPRPGAEAGLIEAMRTATAQEEAEAVAAWIADHWWDTAVRRPAGITAAVLCRRRAQFAAVADALTARGIPVEVVGLGGLLTRPEVSDVVSLLRVVHDPSRGDALMRLLTGPFVRLGAADLDALGAWSRQLRRQSLAGLVGDGPTVTDDLDDDGPSLVEAIDTPPPADWTGPSGEHLSDVAVVRIARLRDAVADVRAAVGHPLPDLVVLAQRALAVDVEVASTVGTLPETAMMQLDAFTDAAASFASSADRPTLGGFLAWLDAAREEERGLDSPAGHVAEGAVQVLTVHASKGLEWDVVAVPGLVEGAFPSHRSYGVPKNGGLPSPSDKGWLTGLGSLPYELRGDAEGLPALPWRAAADLTELNRWIADFSAAGGEHALEEERRLAYVAFTRARRRLLVSSSIWLDGAKPRVTSRFLQELMERPGLVRVLAWTPDPEPDTPNPALADTAAAIWPPEVDDIRLRAEQRAAAWVDAVRTSRSPRGAGTGDAALDASGDLGTPHVDDPTLAALAEAVEVLLAERDAPPAEQTTRLPGHLSTSAFVELGRDPEAYALRLRRPMPAPPATAARLGTEFHAWIEQHYRAAGLVDDADLDGWADDDAEVQDLDRARELFLASEWADRTPLEVEVSLETVIAGIPIRGRIDAVFARPGGGVVIVDWKTGTPPSEDELARRSLQLAIYRIAYARWKDLRPEDVDAVFYYASSGTTVRPPLPSEEDVRAFLLDVAGPGEDLR